MSGTRRDYIRERLNYREQQRAHSRTKLLGCQCPTCIGAEGVAKLIERKLTAQRERTGEAPF
jgi:hypothetical protein